MSLASDNLDGATGTIQNFAGIKLPSGFLWTDGSAVSRSTYARLFSVLTLAVTGTTTNGGSSVTGVSQDLTALGMSAVGWPISGPGIPANTTISAVTSTTITLSQNATASATVSIVIAPHGVGDGATTFNLPDCRGRVVAGRDDMGGTAANRLTTAGGGVTGTKLGHAAGTETHTLATTQIPSHNHGVNDPGHGHANNAAAQYSSGSSGTGGSTIFYLQQAANIQSNTTGVSVQNAGGGQAHPNAQPTVVLNKIIKT